MIITDQQRLRERSVEIDKSDRQLMGFLQQKLENEAERSGEAAGLAAPQIGVAKNVIVLDAGQGLMSLINPEISLNEGTESKEEGCLCLPDLSVTVERWERIQIKGIDRRRLSGDGEEL